jgi:ABC-type Fe3+/spermidine/putrescine transport system ATPase subunit
LNILQLEQVSRDFNGIAAVEAIDLEVRTGEILTLVGPSGCGKTTTLRLAAGLERASQGQVILGGRVVDAGREAGFVPPEQRNIGMVFQSYAMWPHLSVFENVAFPLRVRRFREADVRERVTEVLRLLDLVGLENRPATHLSGGQQQRVAIARALSSRPSLLLMDEPFSSLDARLREQTCADLKLLQQELGLSVLLVTHDQNEALALCDRVAVMANGRIEQIGTAREVYDKPESAFVRDFIGRWIKLGGTIEAVSEDRVDVALASGAIVQARGRSHLARLDVGSPCIVAIRPEAVRISEGAPQADAPAGAVSAAIKALLFRGSHHEAVVETPAGELLSVDLPPATPPEIGRRLHLELPAASVHLWPRDQTG